MPRSRISKRALSWLSRNLITFFEWRMRGKTAIQAEKTGAKLGRLLFRLSKKHRNRALSNLKLVFPEMSESERRKLAIQVFEHFGIITIDFVRTSSRTDKEVLENMEEEGLSILESSLAKGKGVLLFTPHFGNWERFAHYLKARGHEVFAVARDADDAQVQQDVARLREMSGLTMMSRGNAARTILSLLKENKIVGLLTDQNCAESFVPFFGLPTGTVLGPATLSLRTGAPLVPIYCVRIAPGKYRTEILHPIEPKPGFEDNVDALTRSMNDTLESIVRKHPEQWLWFHDRWKSARQRGLL